MQLKKSEQNKAHCNNNNHQTTACLSVANSLIEPLKKKNNSFSISLLFVTDIWSSYCIRGTKESRIDMHTATREKKKKNNL